MQNIMQISKTKRPEKAASREAMLATFRHAVESGAFLQCEAAHALGVQQGQVSKILAGKFIKPTGLALRLYEYANMQIRQLGLQAPAPQTDRSGAPSGQAYEGSRARTWQGRGEGQP